MGRPAKPLKFIELESGCQICVSHALNKDGYLRLTWYAGKGKRRTFEFFHRTVWQHFNGAIPVGHEIDHICGNRACCNIKHLRCLDRATHLVHTNTTRYNERKQKAYEYWKKHKCTGVALSKCFDVSFGSACGWIRHWKEND